MIVVRRDIPLTYIAKHAGEEGIDAAARQFDTWINIAQISSWTRPTDVMQSHPRASILKGGRVVFNIKGNSYRLVCQINYLAGVVEVRFFGTHHEYDQIDAESV